MEQKKMQTQVINKNLETESKKIRGRAMVFGTPDSVGDIFDKNIIIDFGIDGRPVDLLFNHEHTDVYASTRNGSLQLEKSSNGLDFIADVDNEEKIFKRVDTKLADGVSCGFIAKDYEIMKNGAKLFKHVVVTEVSITWEPAHTGTEAFTKNNQEEVKQVQKRHISKLKALL